MNRRVPSGLNREIRKLISWADRLDSYVTLHDSPALVERLRGQKSPLQTAERAAWIRAGRFVLNVDGQVDETDWFLKRLARFYITLAQADVPDEVTGLPLGPLRWRAEDGSPARPIATWEVVIDVLAAVAIEGRVAGAAFDNGWLIALDAIQAHLEDLAEAIDTWAAPRPVAQEAGGYSPAAPTGQDGSEFTGLDAREERVLFFTLMPSPPPYSDPEDPREVLELDPEEWKGMSPLERFRWCWDRNPVIRRDWLADLRPSVRVPDWVEDGEWFQDQLQARRGKRISQASAERYLSEALRKIEPLDRTAPMRLAPPEDLLSRTG